MKKIMFNDKYGLTRAVLEGRKTQTRRIVPQRILDMVPAYQEEYWNGALESISVEDAVYNLTHGERRAKAPYYVGEEVAVAQAYKDIASISDINYVDIDWERATKNKPFGKWGCANKLPGWSNKMFVRADLMPHRIKITNVRVERLQDISEEDCLKEGVEKCETPICHKNYCTRDCDDCAPSPKMAFAKLINKVSGKGTWESNPWVFVYDFELIT